MVNLHKQNLASCHRRHSLQNSISISRMLRHPFLVFQSRAIQYCCSQESDGMLFQVFNSKEVQCKLFVYSLCINRVSK